MEKETFIEKLTSSNTRISGIQEYLKLLPSMDLDDTSIEGTFEFALIPDYCSYGLDGITVKVKRCQVEVRWSMEVEFLSPEELVSAIGAGGVESNSGSIEGTFSLDVAENDESWAIGTDEITFSKKGAISICQVEFQLTNIGKSYLIIS